MPETTAQHWTGPLFDSVRALYERAREYQLAHRAAQVAVETVNIDRRQAHAGRIALSGRTTTYKHSPTHEPHARALFHLTDLYNDLEHAVGHRYEDAALLYASGAAWAISSVQRGDTPAVVTFPTDEDGLDPVPNLMGITGVDGWTGAQALAAAYEAMVQCAGAAEYGEDLAGRDYVTDHEAGEMFLAGEIAEGLADAAFAYGLLAQRALNYVLIEPRRAHESELATARAVAQQTAQPTN